MNMCVNYLLIAFFKKRDILDEATQTISFQRNISCQTFEIKNNKSTQTEYDSEDEWEQFVWTKDLKLLNQNEDLQLMKI